MCDILFPQLETKSFNSALALFLGLYFVATYVYFLASSNLMGCCLYTLGAKFTPKIRFAGRMNITHLEATCTDFSSQHFSSAASSMQ